MIMHQGQRPRRHPGRVAGAQAAHISFAWPPGQVPTLPVLPGGVTVERTHGAVVLRTRDLQVTVSALLEWANQHGLRLHQLTARSGVAAGDVPGPGRSRRRPLRPGVGGMTTPTPTMPPTAHRLAGSIRRIASLGPGGGTAVAAQPDGAAQRARYPANRRGVAQRVTAAGRLAAPTPGAGIVVTLTAFALLFPLYYNLVTTLVARREDLVLKRLRSGESATPRSLSERPRRRRPSPGAVTAGVIAAQRCGGMAIPVNPVSGGCRDAAGHRGVRAARRGQHRNDPHRRNGAAVHPAGCGDLDESSAACSPRPCCPDRCFGSPRSSR